MPEQRDGLSFVSKRNIYYTHPLRDYYDRPAGMVTMSRQDITITVITIVQKEGKEERIG